MTDCSELRHKLRSHPHLKHLASAEIQPLASASHRVFFVQTPEVRGALKWLDTNQSRFIEKQIECANEAMAADLGLTPGIHYTDSEFRFSQWVDNGRPLTPVDLYDDLIADRVIESIARLHNSQTLFSNTISIRQAIEWDIGQSDRTSELHEIWHETFRRLDQVTEKQPIVSCHGDLVCENILLAGQGTETRVQLIDWEYSHNSIAYWDLANLCYSANLGADRRQWLLNVYHRSVQHSEYRPNASLLTKLVEVADDLSQLWNLNRPHTVR
ncbi:MAG: thiamine kinase-like enzyme [Parasphingorhabdus sp.]|jgi:thiamine kinase-like enzyme